MRIDDAERARRIAELTQALKGHGLRLTHQRLEIVREIAGTDAHPDAESVFRSVRERVPTVSLDTVYRTLGTLVDIGMIARVTATSGTTRYDANRDRHHHFVCTKCGLVRDVVDPTLDALSETGAGVEHGMVESVDVHLKGVCRSCEAAAGG